MRRTSRTPSPPASNHQSRPTDTLCINAVLAGAGIATSASFIVQQDLKRGGAGLCSARLGLVRNPAKLAAVEVFDGLGYLFMAVHYKRAMCHHGFVDRLTA